MLTQCVLRLTKRARVVRPLPDMIIERADLLLRELFSSIESMAW